MKLSVVMPVFNEKATIRQIIDKVQAVDLDKELIVVDDGSTDGTRDILHELEGTQDGLRIFFLDRNRGKGSAVRFGIKQAEGDVLVVQDADLEYEPEEFHNLLEPYQKGRAAVVYGSRFLGGHRTGYYWTTLGNKFVTWLTNIIYNSNLTDMETCYKLFGMDVLRELNLKSQRFEFEPEVTAKILKRGIHIYEVPISYMSREYSEGKKLTAKDGWEAVKALVKYRFMD
ncbi:MAG TPA: glycosyltransferase family 2 protein [Chloroflexota bacterium]|jgi:glycosyltransferase involved in cell wall biosynthesis|nr:glycosyltransferase family 2 protein [Chloroflexota bacterium]